MKRLILAAAVGLLSAAQIAAQIQLGVTAGYGFGAGRFGQNMSFEATDTSGFGDYVYDKYTDVYTSLGNGIKLDITGIYNLNDNIGVLASIGFSMLGGASAKTKVTDRTSGVQTETTDKTSGNFLPITIGLKVKADIGTISPYVYIAPGMYIPTGVSGEYKTESQGISTTDKVAYKVSPGFGFNGGLGAILKISDMIGLSAECAPSYAFARISEEKYTYADGSTETYIYKRNQESLPADISTGNADTYYEHGGPMMSFSSIAAKVGVVLSF